jgi:serine O-acetyltransferase
MDLEGKMVQFIRMMREDIQSVFDRDPAARNTLEILSSYPGLHAIWGFRLTHWLWKHKMKLAARWLSHVFRFLTGIEIHPGATIGHKFFIDHGMGVVIGETAEIGENVTLYHGVTLGGTTLEKGKRHPTLEENVVVGAGAKILGAITVGAGSRIGANAVVIKTVPANSVVVGVPGQVVARSKPRAVDAPPDLNHNILPDTIGLTILDLMNRLEQVEDVLSGQVNDHPLAGNIEKLQKLEVSLQGHLYEHSYILGSEGGKSNSRASLHAHKPGNGNGKPRIHLHAESEHHVHAPEDGVWRGEDFSI